jgi:hypothetical protein
MRLNLISSTTKGKKKKKKTLLIYIAEIPPCLPHAEHITKTYAPNLAKIKKFSMIQK